VRWRRTACVCSTAKRALQAQRCRRSSQVCDANAFLFVFYFRFVAHRMRLTTHSRSHFRFIQIDYFSIALGGAAPQRRQHWFDSVKACRRRAPPPPHESSWEMTHTPLATVLKASSFSALVLHRSLLRSFVSAFASACVLSFYFILTLHSLIFL
jgi:hypothetical protein